MLEKSALRSEENSQKRTYSHFFPRRTFLKAVLALAGTLTAIKAGIEVNQRPIEVALYLAEKEGVVDAVLKLFRNHKVKKSTSYLTQIGVAQEKLFNEQKRSITELVFEGVSLYLESNPGSRIKYFFDVDRENFSQRFFSLIQELQNENSGGEAMLKAHEVYRIIFNGTPTLAQDWTDKELQLFQDLLAIKEKVYTIASPNQQRAIEAAEYPISRSSEFLQPGSGLYYKAKEAGYGGGVDQDYSYIAYDSFLRAQLYLGKVYSQNRQSISSSHLLSFFLRENSGNLNLSILDVSLCLKYWSRCKPDGLFDKDYVESHASQIYDQIFSMIQDEFSVTTPVDEIVGMNEDLPDSAKEGFGWYSENSNGSIINLMGLPYHAWSMAANLTYFPKIFVKYMVMWELYYYKTHQDSKSAADITTSLELSSLEILLNHFADLNL